MIYDNTSVRDASDVKGMLFYNSDTSEFNYLYYI